MAQVFPIAFVCILATYAIFGILRAPAKHVVEPTDVQERPPLPRPTVYSALDVPGAETCLQAARDLIQASEKSGKHGLNQEFLCEEEETGFLSINVRQAFSSSSAFYDGIVTLFYQRTEAHRAAIREGREPRLSYQIVPDMRSDLWAVTVTDSLGNKREGFDFIWARNFRAYEFINTAPSSLMLGEPIVYFDCSDREGFTCVASYLVDKCYADPSYVGSSKKHYVLSVAAINPQNVDRMFANYEPINLLAEEILQIITPAACKE